MLREWKTQAEQSSFRAILSGQASSVDAGQKRPSDSSLEPLLQRIRGAAVADLVGFRRAPSWPGHAIALNLRVATGGTERQFNAETVGVLLSAFNELIVVAPPGTGKTTTLLQIDASKARR
jgi:superfamily II DNA or RNA helicase